VIAPDPTQPIRVAVALSTSRHGGRAIGICTAVILQDVDHGGSGCARRARLFAHGPLADTMIVGGSDQFALAEGLASDDVAKIVAFLANRHTQPVPLADNVYAVQIARAKLPAKLVAYDTHGRVIGLATVDTTPGGARPTPAPGRPKRLLHVTSPAATATLYTGPSSNGGRCMYVRWYQSNHATGQTGGCNTLTAHDQAISLSGGGPTGSWEGQARTDVTTVELRFADGSHTNIKPTDGFILYALNRSQLAGGGLTKAIARNAAGKQVGHETFKPTKQ
jgi:hypothetical protein